MDCLVKSHRIPGVKRAIYFLIPLLMILSVAGTAWSYELRVNCGGDAFTGATGHLFYADQPYSGNQWGYVSGYNLFHWVPIGGSPDSILYRTARLNEWPFSYKFNLPNDSYDITLRFNELKYHWYGMSAFSVQAENVDIITDFSVFDEIERFYALDMRFRVEVVDGELDIGFTPLLGGATISAIEVKTTSTSSSGPDPVVDLSITGGYGTLILNWTPNSETDLKGYLIERMELPSGAWQTVQTAEFLVTRYIDKDVSPNVEYSYRVSAVNLSLDESDPSETVSGQMRLREDSELRCYDILATEENLILLNEDIGSDEYVLADFRFEDITWNNIGIRYRGQSTRVGPKKNWKVRFYNTELEDQNRLNLNSGFADPSMVRESLGFRLAEIVGSYTCETKRINLFVNDQHRGLHTQIEQINDHWLAARDLPESCPLYKAGEGFVRRPLSHYPILYERKTDPEDDFAPLADLIDMIHLTPDSVLADSMSRTIDLYMFFNWYAFNIITGNRDFATHNFYALYNNSTDKWSILPWDLDVSLGSHNTFEFNWDAESAIDLGTIQNPDARGVNHLVDRLLTVPKFRWMLAERILYLLSGPLTAQTILAELENEVAIVTDEVAADYFKFGWEEMSLHNYHLTKMRTYIEERCAFLLQEAELYRPDFEFGIRINEFMASNEATIADEFGEYDDWIEILNVSDHPVEMGGLRLSDDMSETRNWEFPDTTIQAGEYLIVWADDDPEQGPLHATFKLSRNGEAVALWDRDEEGNVLIDHCLFDTQEDDISQGRYPDGDGEWRLMLQPSPGGPNLWDSSVPDHDDSDLIPHSMSAELQIYPSVVSGKATISLRSSGRDATDDQPRISSLALPAIGIYSSEGRRVTGITVAKGADEASVNLGQLLRGEPNGIYWMRAETESRDRIGPSRFLYIIDK